MTDENQQADSETDDVFTRDGIGERLPTRLEFRADLQGRDYCWIADREPGEGCDKCSTDTSPDECEGGDGGG